MKQLALFLLLVPTLATADLYRCVIDGKVAYKEEGCVGKKIDTNPDIKVTDAPLQISDHVDVPAPVAGAYNSPPQVGGNQTEPTEYIRSYAGPRHYHDHGPPPYGGTGRYSPYYDHGVQRYNPREGYYDPQPSKSGGGYRRR